MYYWVKNGGEHFRRKDIVFECFHNFLAFSQWGNTLYNTMALLAPGHGDPGVRSWFARTMAEGPDEMDGVAFTPLDRFVMELFRTISPNGGSLSTVAMQRGLEPREGAVVTPHLATSQDPRHWLNPAEFDPDRYKAVPTSAENGEARSKEVGLARCPFPPAPFAVRDGRRGGAHQQCLRRRLRRGRRHALPGVRRGRLRAVRVRLPALRGRTINHGIRQGVVAKGLAGRARVRPARPRATGETACFPAHGHRRQHRLPAS